MRRPAFALTAACSIALIALAIVGCGHAQDVNQESVKEREPLFWIAAVHIRGSVPAAFGYGTLIDAVCIEGESDQVCATGVVEEFTTAHDSELALGQPDGMCDPTTNERGVAINNARLQSKETLRVGFGRELPVYEGDRLVTYMAADDGDCPLSDYTVSLVDRDERSAIVIVGNFRIYQVFDRKPGFK